MISGISVLVGISVGVVLLVGSSDGVGLDLEGVIVIMGTFVAGSMVGESLVWIVSAALVNSISGESDSADGVPEVGKLHPDKIKI